MELTWSWHAGTQLECELFPWRQMGWSLGGTGRAWRWRSGKITFSNVMILQPRSLREGERSSSVPVNSCATKRTFKLFVIWKARNCRRLTRTGRVAESKSKDRLNPDPWTAYEWGRLCQRSSCDCWYRRGWVRSSKWLFRARELPGQNLARVHPSGNAATQSVLICQLLSTAFNCFQLLEWSKVTKEEERWRPNWLSWCLQGLLSHLLKDSNFIPTA